MSKYNNQVDFFTKTRIWGNKVKKSQIRGTFYYIDTYVQGTKNKSNSWQITTT